MLNDYHKIKSELHTSDAEMGNFARNVPQYIRELRRSDEYAAFLAVGVFEGLQKKKDKDVESAYATVLANYYNAWARNGADPSMIDVIDKLADEYPLLDDAIATNTITFGIGQSYLLTTPLNQAIYVAALANGGSVMKPTLLHDVRDASGHALQALHPEITGTVPASAANLMAVREGMRQEINPPYNMNYWFRASGVPADGGGKTGTAQWGGSGLDLPTHAWFVFFARDA